VAKIPGVSSLRPDFTSRNSQRFRAPRNDVAGAVSQSPSLGVSDYKKLNVWRKAHALALNVHRITARVRGSDYASLRSQMMRAAMPIPTNIVEGTGQKSGKEFGRFIRFALNSTSELEYHLIVARDIRAIKASDFDSLSTQTIEVRKMLHGLLKSVVVSTRNATE
jgi:four helix bundle protein